MKLSAHYPTRSQARKELAKAHRRNNLKRIARTSTLTPLVGLIALSGGFTTTALATPELAREKPVATQEVQSNAFTATPLKEIPAQDITLGKEKPTPPPPPVQTNTPYRSYPKVYGQFNPDSLSDEVKANPIIAEALKYLGVPYVWGGTTPNGFDCSGLTSYVYSHAKGVAIPRVAAAQASNGKPVKLTQENVGAILANSRHAAIFAGFDSKGNPLMIHSPRPGRHVELTYASWFLAQGAKPVIY